MYICIYIYYISIYIDTYTHIPTYIYTHVYIYIYTHVYIYTHLQFIFDLYPIPEHPYTSSSLCTSQCTDWIYSSVYVHNCNMVSVALSFDILNMYRCSHIFVHVYYTYIYIHTSYPINKISLRLYVYKYVHT